MPRPFKSWASVYESETSVWTRVRGRLAGLLSRRRDGSEPSPAPDTSAAPAAVTPPQDFQFPWTRSEVEAAAPADAFSSVDEALPSSPDLPQVKAPPSPALRSGLLGRLFPKRPGSESGPNDAQVGAAADALDAVSDAHFQSFDRRPAERQVFDSVADALPDVSSIPLAEIPTKTDEFGVATPGVADDTRKTDVDTLEVDGTNIFRWIARVLRLNRDGVEAAAAENEVARTSAVFLLAKFRAFYNEIIRFQHQKSEFTAGFATAVMADDGSDGSPDAAAEGLSKRLSELLELQAAEAKWTGGEAAQRYPDAQYAMAALADEIFSTLEWEGRSSWSKFAIEQKLYRTRAAELEVFKRIDRLLKESPDSVVARDLARVYLLVLAAGFQGKWRAFGLKRPIAEYRRRLYEYVHGGDALMIYAPDRKMFPEAASRTLAGQAVARYSTAQRWVAILAFLAVSYAVVAHIAWSRASADLKDITTRIKTGSTAATR